MTAKTKRKIGIIAFILLGVAMMVGIVVMAATHKWQTVQGDTKRHTVTDVTYVKVGESVPFAAINPKFKELFGNGETEGFQFHYQSAHDLTVADEKKREDSLSYEQGKRDEVFVDENGKVQALKTGLYQLEYAVTCIRSRKPRYDIAGLEHYPDSYVFSNTVAVYGADESAYEPFPADGLYECHKNYILTEDITVKYSQFADWHNSSFYGVFINPDGHTLTVEMDRQNAPFMVDNDKGTYLFQYNSGIIDGLKIRFVSTEEKPFANEFYALAKKNMGLIKNCEITGSVYLISKNTDVYAEYEEA
ncbi:MAG: hypothetical protein IJX88_04750, partial [Clostridia bacterium]|nr:hypothetical protein [Clostridia bacterium]